MVIQTEMYPNNYPGSGYKQMSYSFDEEKDCYTEDYHHHNNGSSMQMMKPNPYISTPQSTHSYSHHAPGGGNYQNAHHQHGYSDYYNKEKIHNEKSEDYKKHQHYHEGIHGHVVKYQSGHGGAIHGPVDKYQSGHGGAIHGVDKYQSGHGGAFHGVDKYQSGHGQNHYGQNHHGYDGHMHHHGGNGTYGAPHHSPMAPNRHRFEFKGLDD